MLEENVQQSSTDLDYDSNFAPACKIVTYDDRFPSDVLRWMKANVAPRQSIKLMKVCKYFKYRKFPYCVVQEVENYNSCWEYLTLDGEKHSLQNNEDLPDNLWIVTKIRLYRQDHLSTLFQKIAVCDIKYIILHDCFPTIAYNDYKMLTESGNVEDLTLHGITIRYENGDAVPFEVILEHLPKVIAITLNNDFPPIYSLEAATKAMSRTCKYFEFTTLNVEMLHFEKFSKFMLENQQIEYFCSFEYNMPGEEPSELSEEYFEEIRKYVDDIIVHWSPINSPPLINYTEQLPFSYEAMNQLHHLHYITRTYTQITSPTIADTLNFLISHNFIQK